MTASKRKGTAFEVAVRDFIDSQGIACFRTAPAGARDEGDLVVPSWDCIIECKNARAIDLAGAVDEALIEAGHAKASYGIAVVKRRLAPVNQAYVVMPLNVFTRLMKERT